MRAFTAIGFVVGFGCGALALQSYHQNKPKNIASQAAKCEMKAYLVFKKTANESVFFPEYVRDCMTIAGYEFTMTPQCQTDFQMLSDGSEKWNGLSINGDPVCYK
jgi:hypothetical protein